VGHTGAAQSLDQSFFDDAFLNVQGQLAAALLRSAPADTVGETADIGDLLCLHPLAFFGNGSGAMVCALTNGAHVLYFCTINHGNIPFFSKDGDPSFYYVVRSFAYSKAIIQAARENVNSALQKKKILPV
jgi:hypothetical protein